jgi:Methyltransferase domain/Glycosyl transferase family 2
MSSRGNIFACLVHENQECVIDLIRNLRHLDPDSPILLYNGGCDPKLLDFRFPFERYGVVLHPKSQPVAWGHLHPFALDCMRFALESFSFQTLTIVDSDQLAIRPGYSGHIAAFLRNQNLVGALANSSLRQPPHTRISPAKCAHLEIDLWRPLLRRFPEGEAKFVHWSFWPATVFTNDAARGLTDLFTNDAMLQGIMARTKIWASEEVILPTLVALLGYRILKGPFSYDYVQFRKLYTLRQLEAAQTRHDVFWVHPIPRSYDHPLRNHVRKRFGNYEHFTVEGTMSSKSQPDSGMLLTWPILKGMKQIEGWLAEDEADLLIAVTSLALTRFASHALVEIGSYCGRATFVLASVIKALCPGARLSAIDPHDGKVGALDLGIQNLPPTLEKLKHNLDSAGLSGLVTIITARSWEVAWNRPTGFLFIDGLHDYASVARDFYHFEPWLVQGAYIAFHDYAEYYPGVKTFVDELLSNGRYEMVHCASSMVVVRRLGKQDTPEPEEHEKSEQPVSRKRLAQRRRAPGNSVVTNGPLVSCIMPTADRRPLVAHSIRYFMRQDYPNRELIIMDDGIDAIADLVPEDGRISYLRLTKRCTIGEKRNLACERSRGELIAHWDDDDWSADWRLSYQVNALSDSGTKSACGLASILYYDPCRERAWCYVYPEHRRRWVAGNTLCYRKELWQRHRFPHVNQGEDTRFVWSLPELSILPLPNNKFYVATVHQRNSSPKRTHEPWWQPCSILEVQSVMGADFCFYENWSSQIAVHLCGLGTGPNTAPRPCSGFSTHIRA